MKQKRNILTAVTSFIYLSIIIIAVASYLVNHEAISGPAFILLGILNLLILKTHKVELKSVYADMVFGFIDNSVLVLTALVGAAYAGVYGAIIGGVAGNALTDGIGGLFEGYVAQNQRKFKIDNERTPLSTMLGKIAGCLFGAGVGLLLVSFFKMVF